MKLFNGLISKRTENDVLETLIDRSVSMNALGRVGIVKGDKMKKNPLISLREIELKDLCRHHIDSFEQWSRRLIDENFRRDYGENYVDAEVIPGQPLIKADIKKMIIGRMQDNPERFPRWIDAIVMENIEYLFCREDLYNKYFKSILEPFFSGDKEVRSVIKRLTDIRNKLCHGSTISIHEAEQGICYTNDFIECFKKYYAGIGKGREYNVPVFTRIKDSLGNDVIREHMEWYPWTVYCYGHNVGPEVILRSGDIYKIWVEVDGSFEEDIYDVTWKYTCGDKTKQGNGNVVQVVFDDKDVSYPFEIDFSLKTHNPWHRRARFDSDDDLDIHFKAILPPIESTY